MFNPQGVPVAAAAQRERERRSGRRKEGDYCQPPPQFYREAEEKRIPWEGQPEHIVIICHLGVHCVDRVRRKWE